MNAAQQNQASTFGWFNARMAVWRLPDFLVRFMIVLMTRTLYRIKVIGAEKIPSQGPALLVSNHVSRSDALIIGSLGQRRIRFVMSREFYEASHLKWLFRLNQAILISEEDPPKQILRALKTAREALDEGYLVCIFAEGGITRNGLLQAFRGGVERIVKGTNYPIIPLYLGGLWGSIFSYSDGKLGGRPKRIPYPVSIHIGDPLPASATRHEIRQKVLELSCDYFVDLKPRTKSPGEQFLRNARRHWGRSCVSDVTGKDLTYGRTATAAQLLANRLKPQTDRQQNVGIMLPPSVAGTLANVALTLLGKTSVNLSYMCSPQVRDTIAERCRLQHILTSRSFLQKLEFGADDPRYIFVEDLMADVSLGEKLRALLKSRFVPLSLLPVTRHCGPDDVATILFSSGSTGVPKGVRLSHFNISSNLEAARTVFRIGKEDVLCGVLPFFHAFGLTVCLWLPVTSGAAACYLPNPLDGKAVAKTIKEKRATILLATPTFLLGYLRRATREDFASLRTVVVGAEKLKTKLADAFAQRFGLRPQEGYGTTELAPLASLNIADVTLDGTLQRGSKQDSVGQPLPGVATKVVDLESHAPLGPNEPGLLLIKGPNVMLGYLNDPEKTAEVLQDGWYNTGDIASVDEAGFISITDRLSRFSKIGGEMVPHIRVEEICAATIEADEPVVAVTSLPHDKKGEELIVLYVKDKADPKQMHLALSQSDLPNLCKPRLDNFLAVDALPILGSGKLDVMGLKKLARSRRGGGRDDA
ncbi:MAG: AMP-binding protein [Planctomycetes bacterium]|nr:AMP-binding protein [Planctomycetota bacterium]